MAKKRPNQGRRVQPTIAASDAEYKGPSSADHRAELEFYGKKRAQLVDISSQMENIFTLQQQQVQESDRQYGIEKQLLNNLGVYENKVKLIALQKKLLKDLTLEDSNIIKQTVSDYEDYNREAANVTKKTQELLRFRKEQVPFEDKIKGMQAEITNLQAQGVTNLSNQNKEKLKDLQTMEKGYQALSKQEQMNKRIEKIQGNITDAMKLQGTAAGEILSTLKNIVTNPLLIFTGLLALGVSRYEEMRQRGNQLAEEMDRVNKSLAGAGPYQEKILERARAIKGQFYAAGEGFSSSMENAVSAVQALEKQLGNVDFISGELVNQMTKLKLSIGLSDEESSKVLDNFMVMNELSEDAAINASNLTYQLSEAVGLNPQVVFQDIAAASAETLAHFTGGAHQIAKAAVEARRMGLTLTDVASISKGLLDFETSIEAEMEAQMLTGMDLNFNKARMFAMNKQGDKAAAEVMRQVGGIDRFQKMNIFQQEAIAKATGLDLNTLMKSNVQREREGKLARDKDKLVSKQLSMSVEVTKMMGKLDAGLGIMQQIANVLGDLFLDIFMPSMKQGEKTLLGFIKGDKFKNVVTSILKGVKSVVDSIVDIFKWIGNSTVFKAVSNYMGGGNLSASNPGQMNKQVSADRIGNAVKIGLAGYAAFKLGSFLMPMWVRVKGGVGGMFGGKGGSGGLMDGIKKMFGFGGKGAVGPLTKAGLPDMRYAANKGLGGMGGAGAAGTKFMGMNLGSALGGTSGSLGTAMGGTALGSAGAVLGGLGAAAMIGKGFYDVSNITQDDSLASAKKAHAGKGGAVGGALAGAAIGSVIPVIGTLLGAGIGAAIGYFGARASSASANYMTDLERSQERAIEATEEVTELERLQLSKTNQRRIRRQIKVQKSFDGLAKDGDVTGDALKQLSQDLVDSGLVSKTVFAQMSKDGKITSSELNKMLKGITGGWEWGSGKDSPGKKEKEFIIEGLTENKVAIKSLDEILSTVKAGENVKGSLLFDLMSSSTLEGMDNVAKGQKDKRLGYTSYFRGSAASGSLDDGSDADALRFQSIKTAVGDQMTDEMIRKVLDSSYSHTIKLMNEMKTSEKDLITGEDFERSLSLAIVRGISAELTVDKVNLKKAQINVENAVGDVTKISKENAGDIVTKLDEAKTQNSLEQNRLIQMQALRNTNPSAESPGHNFGYYPQSMEDYGAIDASRSARKQYQSELVKISKMSAEELQNYTPPNFDNSSDQYQGLQVDYPSFNSGGILYGPSHAGGGIPTKFGELEGGEAVINKRSTAMHAGLLSRINQSGGGSSFADGGVLGIGPHTAGKKLGGGTVAEREARIKAMEKFVATNREADAKAAAIDITDYDLNLMERAVPYGHVDPKLMKSLRRHHSQKDPANQPIEGGYTRNELEQFRILNHDTSYKSNKDMKVYHNSQYEYGSRFNKLGYSGFIESFIRDYGWGIMFKNLGIPAKSAGDRKALSLLSAGKGLDNDYVRSRMGKDMATTQDYVDANLGATSMRYDHQGNKLSNEETKAKYMTFLSAAGVTTMQNIALSVLGAKQLQAAFGTLNTTYTAARTVGVKQMIPEMVKVLTKLGPLQGTKLTLANAYGLNTVVNKGKDVLSLSEQLVKPNGAEGQLGVNPNSAAEWISVIGKIQEGKYTSASLKGLSKYYAERAEKTGDAKAYVLKYALGLTSQYISPYLDKALFGTKKKEKGGILPTSPITKVNDMILTKDGQMIETHADDNIIAKKGGITQAPAGGGKNRIEELLEELIIVTQQGGNVYMDGSKVSAAINQSNYNA